jgi:hypothetical protein
VLHDIALVDLQAKWTIKLPVAVEAPILALAAKKTSAGRGWFVFVFLACSDPINNRDLATFDALADPGFRGRIEARPAAELFARRRLGPYGQRHARRSQKQQPALGGV